MLWFSSEPSGQSFSPSQCQCPGMHLPLLHLNSVSVQALVAVTFRRSWKKKPSTVIWAMFNAITRHQNSNISQFLFRVMSECIDYLANNENPIISPLWIQNLWTARGACLGCCKLAKAAASSYIYPAVFRGSRERLSAGETRPSSALACMFHVPWTVNRSESIRVNRVDQINALHCTAQDKARARQ